MNLKNKLVFLSISTVVSISAITILHLESEQMMRTDNNFTRMFMHKALPLEDKELGLRSFYFAGTYNGALYLGSQKTPLEIVSYDSLLNQKRSIRFDLNRKDLPFRTVQFSILGKDVYLFDPTIPALFKGSLTTGKAYLQWKSERPIQRYALLDSLHMTYSFINQNTESELGLSYIGKPHTDYVNASLLEKQVDGLFDSDRILHYDNVSGRIVFLYHYRNQFIVADKNLSLLYRGKTIDTNSVAKIQVTELAERSQKKLAAPPLVVNAASYVHKNLLFIKSGLKSQTEPDDLWNVASVVDVYNLQRGDYIASFYVYNIGKEKLETFIVDGPYLYGKIGSHLIKYKLGRDIIDAYNSLP